MKELVSMICPEHRQDMARIAAEIAEYACPQGCRYPILRGIPRFVEASSYVDSFGLQWNTFRKTQLDSYTGVSLSQIRLARIAGGNLDVFRGKLILEAGCGAGRFTEVMLGAGGRVVATDLSSAVDANFANCSHLGEYFVCQADIWKLPFNPGSFDVVVCVGVIQHTPDPEVTINTLCMFLKPNGILLIDHYPPEYPATLSRRMLRWGFLKVSPKCALSVCSGLVKGLWPIHKLIWRFVNLPGVRVIPGIRKIRSAFLWLSPVVDYQSAYPELGGELLRVWALLDTHDTLTDRFKHFRSAEQINSCLSQAGMVDITTQLGGNGVETRARRPTATG